MKQRTIIIFGALGAALTIWTGITSIQAAKYIPKDGGKFVSPAEVKKILNEPDKARKWTDGKKGKTDDLKVSHSEPRQTAGSLGDVLAKAPSDFGSNSILKGDVSTAKLLIGRFEVAAVVPITAPFQGAALLLEPLDKQPDTHAQEFAVWAYCADDAQMVIDAHQAWLNNPRDRSKVTIGKAAPLVLMASTREGNKVYLHALPTSPKNGIAGIIGGASISQQSGSKDLAAAAKAQARDKEQADKQAADEAKQAQSDDLKRQAAEKRVAALAHAENREWAKAKATAKEADQLTETAAKLTGKMWFGSNEAERAVIAKSDAYNRAVVDAYNERLRVAQTAKQVENNELERKIRARELTGEKATKAIEEIQARYNAAIGQKPEQVIWDAL